MQTCQFCQKILRNKYQLKLHIAQHLGTSSKKISDGLLVKQDVLQKQRNHCQLPDENNDSRVKLESTVSSVTTTFDAAVKCEITEEVADISDRVELFEQSSSLLDQRLLISSNIEQPLSMMTSYTTSTTSELKRPEVMPAVCNTSLNQVSAIPSTPPCSALMIYDTWWTTLFTGVIHLYHKWTYSEPIHTYYPCSMCSI